MKYSDKRLVFGLVTGVVGALVGWRWLRRGSEGDLPRLDERPGRALITGASSGIGAAFARRLAAEGYDLILVARREERLQTLAATLQSRHGIEAEVLPADLSQPAQVSRVEQRLRKANDLTLLINNAGFGTLRRFVEIDLETQLAMIEVNLVAGVRLTHAALPGMIERGQGGVINVSSIAAFMAAAKNVTYGATKRYLNAFTEGLQEELRATGVRAQVLCPGFTRTEFHDSTEFAQFERDQLPDLIWMSSEAVVEESLAGLRRNQTVVIPGWQNRLSLIMLKLPLAGRVGRLVVRVLL